MLTKDEWKKLDVLTSGLTSDLFVPIAARDIDTIEAYIGSIVQCVPGRKRSVNAVVVAAPRPVRNPLVPLWELPEADHYYDRLHPEKQLWVHVDYTGYRRAWKRLGFGELSRDVFLDHVKNREAVRISGYRRPFLRLCPISRATNTSGGLNSGAEGIEKTELKRLKQLPEEKRRDVERALSAPVVLADPADLTKMLDIPPGLSELQGVASMLMKFYAREAAGS